MKKVSTSGPPPPPPPSHSLPPPPKKPSEGIKYQMTDYEAELIEVKVLAGATQDEAMNPKLQRKFAQDRCIEEVRYRLGQPLRAFHYQ